MLRQVLQRARGVRMSTPIAAEALRALALLPRADDAMVVGTFAAIAARDTAAASHAFEKTVVDPTKAEHGRRVACMCRALAVVQKTDAVVWRGLEQHVTAGLTSAAWHPRDVRDALRGTARWGTYNRTTLPAAVDRYAATKAPFADGPALASIAAAISSLPESQTASSLHTIAQRLTSIADGASAQSIAEVCRAFVRLRFKAPELLAAVLEQLPRIVPKLQGAEGTALLAFWALHDYSSLVPLLDVPDASTSSGRRAAAAATEINAPIEKVHENAVALLQAAVTGMPDHVDGVCAMLRCLNALSTDQWQAVSAAADDALSACAVVSQELLAGGVGVEDLTALMPRFYRCVRDRPARLMPHEVALPTLDAFAEHAESRAEELVAHESSPYFIVTCLLGATGDPPPVRCRKAATEILLEAKAQDAALPTLQTFRYILSFGDNKDFDRRLVGYLRRNFATTLEGIPLVQLCTGLRCFAVAELHGMEGDADMNEGERQREAAELADFLGDIAVSLQRRGYSFDMRLLLSLCHSVSLLAPDGIAATDTLREYLRNVMATICTSNPVAANHNKMSAAATLQFFAPTEDATADVPEAVLRFLREVAEQGQDGDPLEAKPSAWMKENDPSSTILPRTASELKLDAILKDVAAARPDDDKAFTKLGERFLRLLPEVHADNVRLIFEIFADRVIKQDKLLRDSLAHLIDTDAVPTLSPFSIASILRCAAAVRFTYYKQLKALLERVTDEQWAQLDPAEIEMTVASLAKLSIRSPAVILALCDRAVALAPVLTERHVCSVIAAFQSLSVHDDALFSALLSQAAKHADALSPGAVAHLLSGPQAYRLPLNEQNAGPLVQRLCRVSEDLSAHQKTRISQTLKKTTLPPAMLSGATAQLLID